MRRSPSLLPGEGADGSFLRGLGRFDVGLGDVVSRAQWGVAQGRLKAVEEDDPAHLQDSMMIDRGRGSLS